MNLIEFIKKHKIFLVFTVFFFLLLLQHQFLHLFFDDYAYGSLSYSYVLDGIDGTNYNIIDIAKFCFGHYFSWGGRVICYFFEALLLRMGLPIFRIGQSLIITCIFYLIYLIVKRYAKSDSIKLPIFIISLYGLIDIAVIRSGYFWIAASTSYVFPMLPLLLFIYLYDKDKKSKLDYIVCAFSIFLASFSQEQIGACMFIYILFKTVYNYIVTKKLSKSDLIMALISLIGFSLLMLAPGNFVRVDGVPEFYNLSLIGKMKITVPTILNAIFYKGNKYFIDLVVLIVCFISVFNYKKKPNLINKLCILFNGLFLLVQVFTKDGYWSTLIKEDSSFLILQAAIFALNLIPLLYSIIYYLIINKLYFLLNILICAVVSQGVMVISPYYPMRSIIMFQLLLFIFLAYVFINKKNSHFYLIIIVLFSVLNYTYITIGYYQNNETNTYNHKTILEVSKKIKEGNDIKDITLKKLPNPLFANVLPYEQPDIIYFYMREYYDLPNDFNFIYR